MSRQEADLKSNQAPTPRAVSVSCAAKQDGRVDVTVSVDPAEDLDAAGGVFVDVILAGSDRATRKAESARTAPPPGIRSVSAVGPRAANDPRRLRPIARAPKEARRLGAIPRTYTAHLIAPGRLIATGHAETFRTEIVLTGGSPTGLSWFVRGRCAHLGGAESLRSAWVRVNDDARIA